jgi:hypothetical protein
MAKPKIRLSRKSIFLFVIPLAAAAVAILVGVSGFAFAASQEEHDTFCTSCHTQPESTYYQRSIDAQPVDLASAHKAKEVKCINCHSGPGLTGRLQAELLGARNALAWITHTATQPAPLTFPIRDANCLKCHREVTSQMGENNHFHGLLSRWQAADSKAGTCVSCHKAHTIDDNTRLVFLNKERTEAVCEACHRVIGERE